MRNVGSAGLYLLHGLLLRYDTTSKKRLWCLAAVGGLFDIMCPHTLSVYTETDLDLNFSLRFIKGNCFLVYSISLHHEPFPFLPDL
jgi:hypothetical protein